MNKKIIIFIIVSLLCFQEIHGEPLHNYAKEYTEAVNLMQNGQYKKAIEIMTPLTKTNENYHLFLSLGDAHASILQPKKALKYYKIVYLKAKKSSDNLFTRIALFKIAKLQLWMGKIEDASHSYKELLAMQLPEDDIIIAENGLKEIDRLKVKKIAEDERNSYENKIQQARNFLALGNGKSAFQTIQIYLKNTKDFRVYMIAAGSMAITDKPKNALDYYEKAFEVASLDEEKTSALYNIARMHFWLAHYVRAEKTFSLLLNYNLTPNEKELAIAGIVKSRAYYDRPRKAYKTIPKDLIFTTPELTIAAAQSAAWANWADISKSILTKYQPITDKINPNSALSSDLKDLQWQTKLATSKGVITPSLFASHDSENFNKTRVMLDYSRFWSQLAQTSAGIDYIDYSQYSPNRLHAKGFYIGQTIRPTRAIILRGQIEPTEYKNLSYLDHSLWSPFLWNANVDYTPNDYMSLRFGAVKEVIETFGAFDNKITDNQYAGSLSLDPTPYLNLNGSYSYLKMSDTNDRNTYNLSATVNVLPSYGLSATGMVRGFTDKFTSPYYFSPHSYWADTIMFKLGRKLGPTWHYYLDGGVGRQYIVTLPDSPTASSPTYQWGLGITGPINSWLVLNAYYADIHQASAFLDSNNYHYQYGGVSLNFMLPI